MSSAPSGSRELWFFLAARFSGAIGIQIQSVAIGWEIYARTGKVLNLGWVGLAQFVPLAILSLWAGGVADRYDRRTILRICRTLYAIGAFALATLTFAPRLGVLPVYAVLTILGAIRAFAAPAEWALLPGLVESERLPRAIGMSSSTFQLAMVVGPALGGLLCGSFGSETAFVCAGVSELISVGLLFAIRSALPKPEAPREIGVSLLFSGLRYVWRERILLGAISLDLFAVLLGGAVALLPVYARDILDVGELGYGFLRSAPASGAALVAILLALRPIRRRAGVLMFVGVAIFGVATIVFALSTSYAVSLVALAVLGGADMISVVIRQSLVQLSTPDAMRGRVSSVSMIFIGASNELGEFESGLTAAWLGTVRAAVVGGIGTLLVTGLWAVLFPQLRKADALERKE